MDNLEVYSKYRAVPKEAQKPILGGRMKGKTDINPMWRLKSLTEQFGLCGVGWYYKTIRKWTEIVGVEIAVFVDIELFVKVDGAWSMPISGTGGSMLATQESSKVFVSDECYKMATTDAISVACKQLGFGADIYWDGDKSKYDTSHQSQQTNQSPSPNRTELIKFFEAELIRTGQDRAAVLKKEVQSDSKFIKSERLIVLNEALKKLPTKA